MCGRSTIVSYVRYNFTTNDYKSYLRCKRTKKREIAEIMPIQILKILSVTERNIWDDCSDRRISDNHLRADNCRGKSIPWMYIFEQCRYKLYHNDFHQKSYHTFVILITSQHSIGITFSVLQKTPCISLFNTKTKKVSSM